MKCRLGRIRRWLHGLLGWSTYVALALLVILVTAVVALRWVDPPTSAFIERYRVAVIRADQPDRRPRQRWVTLDQMDRLGADISTASRTVTT